MRIILSALALIIVSLLFFKAKLGLLGLLFIAVVLWNLFGSIYETYIKK